MQLYFANKTTTITTLLLIGIVGFMIYSYMNRVHIHYWGRRTFILAAVGLEICCYAATRDGLVQTIQHAIAFF